MAACLKISCMVSLANFTMELLFARFAEMSVYFCSFNACIFSAYVKFSVHFTLLGAGLSVFSF